jgi:type I restriction enzyme S subunit
MKKGWTTKPLAELCEVFADGDWVESKDQSSDGIRLIQTGNVGDGLFKDRAEKARYISEATFKRLRCTEIFEGDCLISRLPDPVGRSCLLPDTGERMITAVDCTIVRFKRDTYLPEFFNLYSQSDEYLATVAKECTGTTRSRISRSNLGLTPIPVPPLAEQQRIVGVLDEAFAGLATAQAHAAQNLQNARALFESHLQSVFTHRAKGWVDATLADVLAVLRNGMNCKQDKSGVGSKISRIESIWNARFDITRVGYAEIAEAQKEKFLLKKGDVLFSHINSAIHVGKTALFDLEDEVVHGVNLLLMRTKSFILPSYLDLYLKHIFSAGYWLRVCKQSINQASVNQQDINRVPFRYPDLERQRAIVEQMDALAAETQRLTRLYEQKQAALAALKKSVLHQAFTGEL